MERNRKQHNIITDVETNGSRSSKWWLLTWWYVGEGWRQSESLIFEI